MSKCPVPGCPVLLPCDDCASRQQLVDIGTAMLKSGHLPKGFNAVVVTTDPDGKWCAVSSSDHGYTRELLIAAQHGAELQYHSSPSPGVPDADADSVAAMPSAAVPLVASDNPGDGAGATDSWWVQDPSCPECHGKGSQCDTCAPMGKQRKPEPD